MAKFTDPNYEMLKSYFDILVAERVGTQKSILLGPGRTVASLGGLYSVLYEEHPTRGFVSHRFKILEIAGNRFKMEYKGLDSTFSLASSAFDVGNSMFFRKDSFFHYWLARPDQDEVYHNYVNQNRTFLFFGNIWPVSNESNTYSIQFEGLKDYTLNALPKVNQTVNMKEWLQVYWDQIHHEVYNMTKTSWSLFDAREIDIRWLGYIASIYGIDITEQILSELPLREWVENLPYFLKRVGTYNALYIVWKVFLSNTKNKLNVYERWGEWCDQNLSREFDSVEDNFIDHHFLEFYRTQPSGGSGDYYYSQYNPDTYPTHTLQVPNKCSTYMWNTGNNENYYLFNKKNLDLDSSVGDIHENKFDVNGYDPTQLTTQVIYLSGGDYSGDFTHSIGIEMSSSVTSASNIVFWALSNEYGQMFDHIGDYLSISFETSGGNNRYFKVVESEGGINNVVKSSESYNANKAYYLVIDRNSSDLDVMIYSKKRRWNEDLLETLSLSLLGVDNYSFLYVLNGRRIDSHSDWYGTVYDFSDTNTQVETVASSGSYVITPHYKVQIDLSTEALGDIFDTDVIVSEDITTDLLRNWEYVRPVSKYVHYEELIAPMAKIDRVGNVVSMYPKSSNGYMNTIFTGSVFLSAGGDILNSGSNTASHYQQYASRTWTIQHDLNIPYVLVQPWVFNESYNGSKLKTPDTIQIVNNNTVRLTFDEPVRGLATIAGSGSTGISYIETAYENSPNSIWNINHNLSTNTPSASGYSSPAGPIVMHYDNNGLGMIPTINDLATDDILMTHWSSSVSGNSIIRRSDYIHNQYDPSDEWIVQHNLNSLIIVQVYNYVNGEEFTSSSIEEISIIDRDSLKVKFYSNQRGHVHVIQVLRNQVTYSPYSCDLLGVGICADTLGYWKVGTGTNILWNPYVENDIETSVTSGLFKSVEQDLNNVYIDFIVPSEFQDTSITEIGLFNYLDELVLYSRCSELFKPKDMQTYFHYRITKFESSSSSSSSTSSSSSSST